MTVDFMILGAQKAATTTLQAGLMSCPGIFMPRGESAFFEDPDYSFARWETFGQRNSQRETVCGIKRPDSLCRADLIPRISAAIPDARFIAVLRDPIARAVSAYVHLVRHAHLPPMTLDEALDRAIHAYRQRGDLLWRSIVEFGQYGRFLSMWYDVLPRASFLVLGQRELSNDLSSVIARSCLHVGGRPTPNPVLPPRDRNVGVYDRRAVLVHRLGHRIRSRPLAGSLTRRAPRAMPLRIVGAAVCSASEHLPFRGAAFADVSPRQLQQLSDIFLEDLQLLRGIVGPTVIDWEQRLLDLSAETSAS
jgi:hypothetical protein